MHTDGDINVNYCTCVSHDSLNHNSCSYYRLTTKSQNTLKCKTKNENGDAALIVSQNNNNNNNNEKKNKKKNFDFDSMDCDGRHIINDKNKDDSCELLDAMALPSIKRRRKITRNSSNNSNKNDIIVLNMDERKKLEISKMLENEMNKMEMNNYDIYIMRKKLQTRKNIEKKLVKVKNKQEEKRKEKKVIIKMSMI